MDRIKSKLRKFKKKYFFNEWLKGFLHTLLLGVVLLMVIVILEGVGKFSSGIRTFLFYLFCVGAAALFVRYTLWTFYKWMRYKRFLSDVQSAKAIRSELSGVNDYLISYLELDKMEPSEWVSQGKAQMESKLHDIEFGTAVSWKENKKRGLLLIIPAVIIGFAMLTDWGAQWIESSERIVKYSEEFAPVAPFDFINLSPKKAIANTEVSMALSISKGYRPQEIYLVLDQVRVSLLPGPGGEWNKNLRMPNHDFSFSFEVDGYSSPVYSTEVFQLPVLTQYSMVVTPPPYTKQSTQYLSNAGDFTFLEGSKVEWNVLAKHAETTFLTLDTDQIVELDDGTFVQRFYKPFSYSITLENADSSLAFPFNFKGLAIADQAPAINSFTDSITPSRNFLEAYVSGSDDYQVSQINWYAIGGDKSYSLLVSQPIKRQSGNHYLYIDTVDRLIESGIQSIVARLYDNNGVRGPQFSETPKIELVSLSREERNQIENNRVNKSSKELSNRAEKINKLRKDAKELQAQDGKKWSDVQKQKKLLKEYKEEIEKLKQQQKELSQQLEKQEETPLTEEEKKLAEILEKLNDPELQKYLESLEEKADQRELSPEDLEELSQEMDYQVNQLERLEELYKDVVFKMELDQQLERIQEAIQRTEESIDKSEESQDSKDAEEAQEEAQKRAEEVADAQRELEKKNQELKQPYKGMEEGMDKADSAKKKAKEATEQMKSGEPSKSQKQKQESKEDLEALQSLLAQMQSSMSEEKKKENIEHMEQLLDNVVWVSFTEEDLYDDFREISVNNPAFKEKLISQGDLSEKLDHIQDSLDALMYRVPELDPVLDKKVRALKAQQQKTIKALQDANMQEGGRYQRDIMYNLNYIAWVLSDLLQQMRQDLSSQMKGNQNCQKPGGSSSSPSASQMLKMQQELGKEFGESGPPEPGGQKPSGKKGEGPPMSEGEDGSSGMPGKQAKELAKMLARQEQIRMELEKKVESGGPGGDAVESMKEFEKELVDPQISFEQKKERLQEIETRLLEVEEAERTQEKEEERESENLELYMNLRQKSKEEYLQRKKSYKEDLTISPIWLQEYYSRIKRSYND